MKKSLLVFLVLMIALIGCSLDMGVSPLSPPDWTTGTWNLMSGDTIISSLTFSSDNVIWNSSGLGFDFKALDRQQGVSISDSEGTSTQYQFTMENSGQVQTYTFTLVSPNTLNMSINTSGIIQNLNGFVKL